MRNDDRTTYTGEPASGTKFFELLNASDVFCMQLGRAMLAAGRLESELRRFLAANGVVSAEKSTLGQLTKLLERHGLLPKMLPHLSQLSSQRNYLAHSLHALFSELVDETILSRSDLVDTDVYVYTDRARTLCDNLKAIADIVADEGGT